MHAADTKRIFHDEKIFSLFNFALSEISNDNIYKNKILESIFHQIVIYVIRDVYNIHVPDFDISDKTLFCYQIMNYIDLNIFTIRNLTEISDYFNYNYDYLANLFKKTVKQKLSDYFIDHKLESARILLLENKKTVTEIAAMTNYADVFAFSKAFKKKYGVSPLKYKQYNNKKTYKSPEIES